MTVRQANRGSVSGIPGWSRSRDVVSAVGNYAWRSSHTSGVVRPVSKSDRSNP